MLEGALHDPITRHDSEHVALYCFFDMPMFLLTMEVMTFTLFTANGGTSLGPVVQGMVFRFLPSMAHLACESSRTSVYGIVGHESF